MQRSALPKTRAKRERTIRFAGKLRWKSCERLDERDIAVSRGRLRLTPTAQASRIVGRPNFLSENFLLRYRPKHHSSGGSAEPMQQG